MSALTERWKPTQVTVIARSLLTVLISELLKVFVALGLFETILNAPTVWSSVLVGEVQSLYIIKHLTAGFCV